MWVSGNYQRYFIPKVLCRHVYEDHLLAINQLNEIRNQQMQIRMELIGARLESDAFEVMAHTDKVTSHIFKTDNLIKEYANKHMQADEKQLYDTFIAARLNFGKNGVLPMIDILQAQNYDQADKLRQEVLTPAYTKASEAIDALIEYQVAQARNSYERVSRLSKTVLIATIGAIAGGMLLIGVFGVFIARSIGKNVSQLQQATSRLADGELATRVHLANEDELGVIARVVQQNGGRIVRLDQPDTPIRRARQYGLYFRHRHDRSSQRLVSNPDGSGRHRGKIRQPAERDRQECCRQG